MSQARGSCHSHINLLRLRGLRQPDTEFHRAHHAANTLSRPDGSNGATCGARNVIRRDRTGKPAPMSQLAITTAHEIYGHALPLIFGQPWRHERTYSKGAVNQRVADIEKRTRELHGSSKYRYAYWSTCFARCNADSDVEFVGSEHQGRNRDLW